MRAWGRQGSKAVDLKFRIAVYWLAGLWLLALPASAQVQMDGLNMTLGGNLGFGYSGGFSNLGQSGHGTDINGTGYFSGYYYNPNFISFSAQPYYGRSQDNSDSQSIFDNGGISASASIFSGSHFPGTINFSKTNDNTGTFGIPGISGLLTKNDGQTFGIGWGVLLPGLPTLSVGFSDGSGSSSLLGTADQSESSNRVYSLRSTYKLRGFDLSGGITRQTVNVNSLFLAGTGEGTSDSSSTTYDISVGHALPLHGYFSSHFGRTNYNDVFDTGSSFGTTDTATAVLGFVIKVPVTITANYTDDLFGSLEQQLVSQGQPLLLTDLTPKSSQLSVTASSNYSFHHFDFSGYVSHTGQSFGNNSYGITQFGGNVAYNFARILHGLTIVVGVVNTAAQTGNQRAALVGAVNYNHNLGGWDFNANCAYDQSTNTFGIVYTTSSLTYSANIRRKLAEHLAWSGGFAGSKSAFEQQAGSAFRSEGFNSSLNWRRYTLSGFYSQSSGTSVFTALGLLPVPLPAPVVPASSLTFFSARSRGASLSVSPRRRLSISGSYSKSDSNTMSPAVGSINGTDIISSRADYQFRKVYFNAGYLKFRQLVSASGTPPSMVASYYFGLSRWFDFF